MTMLSRLTLAMLLSASLISISNAQEVAGPEGSTLYVKVAQTELSGTPIELAEIKVTTSFGDVSIPLAKIDGIKMHADADDSAVIAFKNGDLVTGKVVLETINLKTSWGTAKINTSQIDTVMASRTARFYPEASGGTKGWRFTTAAPATPVRQQNNFGVQR
ncbi:MAG: hypothetical protein AB8B55_21400 [Mariniblastus sp.]